MVDGVPSGGFPYDLTVSSVHKKLPVSPDLRKQHSLDQCLAATSAQQRLLLSRREQSYKQSPLWAPQGRKEH